MEVKALRSATYPTLINNQKREVLYVLTSTFASFPQNLGLLTTTTYI